MGRRATSIDNNISPPTPPIVARSQSSSVRRFAWRVKFTFARYTRACEITRHESRRGAGRGGGRCSDSPTRVSYDGVVTVSVFSGCARRVHPRSDRASDKSELD